MGRSLRFLLPLLVGVATLVSGAYFALTSITRDWFEADLELRSRLAVASAGKSLGEQWSGPAPLLADTLTDISRDERIIGAAACSTAGKSLAQTESYPLAFSCEALSAGGQNPAGARSSGSGGWSMGAELPSGPVHVTAVALGEPQARLGTVILVHDLRFLSGREATTRNALVVAFLILALVTGIMTLFTARIAWRSWTSQLRRALAEGGAREFQPLLRDVRELASRLASERDHEVLSGRWSPQRLRATLTQYLSGERVVVLANREPYIHEKSGDGIKVVHPASGLVTALEPVLRACSGVWVAHGAGSADRETVDQKQHVAVPPGEESYILRRVWMNEAEENGYYYGFSNEGLWPLCHLAHTRPIFRVEDWEHYKSVNQKFANAVCEEVTSDDPIILVQDYHFALAPKMIREKLPRATILTFWHIPWPNAERIGICPWRDEIIAGLLGSSILGFHTQQHCNNFIDAVDAFVESRIDREANAIIQRAQRTLVRPYPISIEWPVHWLDGIAPIDECRASVRRELELEPDALLGVGVDRLDYTKGIEERMRAVDELLTRYPQFRGRFTFVQLAAPSRTKIGHYQDLNDRVVRLADEINQKWGAGKYRAIALRRAHHEPPDVYRYFRGADLCYVSSLHDGMNLVAKEFVAARDDEKGVLILSEFTGAARDLTEALIVNPYDIRQASEALAVSLRMPLEEQRERMRSMRRMVSQFNVYRWAGQMLMDAAENRRRERMAGRLSPVGRGTAAGDAS